MNNKPLWWCAIFLLSCPVRAQSLTMTSPNRGENWPLGSVHAVTWTADRITAPVRLVLYHHGVKVGIMAVSIPASPGSYTWTVGQTDAGTAAVGTGYAVRVRTLSTTGETIFDDSDAAFTICPEIIAALPPHPVTPLIQRVFNLPVTFKIKHKNRERHQWNCLATMGTAPITVPPTEFLVGFENHCADRGPLCADECLSQIYRASPLFDAARLYTLVGKTITKATLSFHRRSTDADPPCPECLQKLLFYSGVMGEMDPPPSEARMLAVSISGTYQVDVTAMMGSWLREKDPAYHGQRHNYIVEFVGINERMDFNNQRCLSYFDNGSLSIQYHD